MELDSVRLGLRREQDTMTQAMSTPINKRLDKRGLESRLAGY